MTERAAEPKISSATLAAPVAEVYTNPSSAAMAERYFSDVGAFETSDANPWRSPPSGTGR